LDFNSGHQRFRSPGQRVRLTGAQAVSLRPMPQGATRADVGLIGRRCPEGCQKAALFCADAFPARRGSFGMRRCLAPTPTADARGRSLTRTLRSLRPLALSGDFDSAMRRFESCRPSTQSGLCGAFIPFIPKARKLLPTVRIEDRLHRAFGRNLLLAPETGQERVQRRPRRSIRRDLLLQGRRFPSKTWRWKRGIIPHCMDEGHDQAEIV
jgi:hypothetical protein